MVECWEEEVARERPVRELFGVWSGDGNELGSNDWVVGAVVGFRRTGNNRILVVLCVSKMVLSVFCGFEVVAATVDRLIPCWVRYEETEVATSMDWPEARGVFVGG